MLSKWRRLHYPGLVAETSPVPGIGTWIACAYRQVREADAVCAPAPFTHLTAAQATADDLVRTMFGHVCVLECGQWTRRTTATRKR
jgi:hypothetical protein